jgi:hypothetical protein
VRFERDTHFLSYRKNEFRVEKVAAFTRWLLERAGVEKGENTLQQVSKAPRP